MVKAVAKANRCDGIRSMVLQGLLDATAAAIHKKYGMAPTPPLGIVEELPRYSAAAS